MLVAIFLIGIGILFLVDATQCKKEHDKAKIAMPMQLKVDLSQCGSYDCIFSNTYNRSHGTYICLNIAAGKEAPGAKDGTATAEKKVPVLKGFEGKVEIINAGGNIEVATDITESNTTAIYNPNDIYTEPAWSLYKISSLPLGQYMFKLTVIKPAAELSDIEQSMVAGYEFCGLEATNIFIGYAIGGLSFSTGLLIAIVLIVIKIKRYKTVARQSEFN